VVPFAWFRSAPGNATLDFQDFEVTDSGQTIRLGNYEAARKAQDARVDTPLGAIREARRAARLQPFSTED